MGQPNTPLQALDLAALVNAVGELVQPISADIRDLRASIMVVMNEVRKEQQAQRRDIDRLQEVSKVLRYLGAVFGSAVLALIWGLITGQVTVVFK
jgi:hypothetical protein